MDPSEEGHMEGRVLDLLIRISGTTERMVERVDQMREKQEDSAQRIEQLRQGQERNDRNIEQIQVDVSAIRSTLKRKGIVNGDNGNHGTPGATGTPGAGGATGPPGGDAATEVADRVLGALLRHVAQAHGGKVALIVTGLLGLLVAGAIRFDVDLGKAQLIWDVIVR